MCAPKTVGFLTMGPTSLLVTKLDAFVVSTWAHTSTDVARACVDVTRATSRDPRYMTMDLVSPRNMSHGLHGGTAETTRALPTQKKMTF